MNNVGRAFGNYFRQERDRCDQTLADVLEIVIKEQPGEDAIIAILERLEKHWCARP